MRNTENARLPFSTCAALVLSTLLAAIGRSDAAPLHTRTATVHINGSVAADCTLSALPISFTIGVGAIHSPGNNIVKQSSLTIRCSKGAHVTIGMNTGLYGNAAGTQFGSRSMKASDGSYLGYDLCHDSGCASVWAPSGYNYNSPNDQGSTLPVFARIVTGQSKVKQGGTYTDSVTVTVNF